MVSSKFKTIKQAFFLPSETSNLTNSNIQDGSPKSIQHLALLGTKPPHNNHQKQSFLLANFSHPLQLSQGINEQDISSDKLSSEIRMKIRMV